ncbi:MAG TPA: L-seryl-tRNA(Sec) selenium transferase [Solirubrobacteraceae bacterium]|jgi:L-seryl-tRNA(Ser) seleniumtransferase|nr:L-seryl-tRNA(Sec) selenium transferase [Solirubrobacteraceae bacterium]
MGEGSPPGNPRDQLGRRLRALPAVDRLAADARGGAEGHGDGVPASEGAAISAARAVIGERRRELQAGVQDDVDLCARVRARLAPSLRRVLNATGVVLHTNLGRAPLPEAAVAELMETARGYCNLEIDLADGRRGSREQHVRALLCELTGAQDALAVNNGAGAVLLAVAALGARGGAIAVSRGQLVEIGGGFRIPEVIAQAGVRLVEVGTTNRTRLSDYERAIEQQSVGALLSVHQSNFRTLGFVEQTPLAQMCTLGVPVIDDVGSGAMLDVPALLADEPPVARSVGAGAALVCFSGDKLLGGPQAGLMVGRTEAVDACRRHPLARALRIGRLPLAALEATLALYRDPERALAEVPVLAMLGVAPDTLAARADGLARAAGGHVVESVARVGGGALPLLELPGPVVAIDPGARGADALAGALRDGAPPLIARVERGRVILDPRTLADEELECAAGLVRAAVAQP